MRPRAVLLAALLVTLAATSARAQDRAFERVLADASASWGRGDAEAIASLSVRGGLFIYYGNRSFGPLGTRHAAGVLREIFKTLGTALLRRKSVQLTGGPQPRGYGEFTWLAEGVPQATVFLGLIREDHGWRLAEIRVSIPGWEPPGR